MHLVFVNFVIIGRIKPDFSSGILEFTEMIYWDLPIVKITEHFIELDLGASVHDFSRFRGCSEAPILDTRGRVVGLVTHGHPDPKAHSILGYRFDKLKTWIDIMYFDPAISPQNSQLRVNLTFRNDGRSRRRVAIDVSQAL